MEEEEAMVVEEDRGRDRRTEGEEGVKRRGSWNEGKFHLNQTAFLP